jgi:tRNA 2-thiocytidine biosynthesis protein TtcA
MMPKQALFNNTLTLIRPLAFLEEGQVKGMAKRLGLIEVPNPCPSVSKSYRREIKDFLGSFYARNRKIRGNIFHALSHVRPDYLPTAGLRGHKDKG